MCSKNFGTFKNFVTGVICSHLLAVQSLSGTRYNSEKIEKPVKTGRKQCLKDLSKSGSDYKKKRKSENLVVMLNKFCFVSNFFTINNFPVTFKV